MKESLRILIISFFFAPDARVGGKRFSFLTFFWQKEIAEIHVLTAKLGNSMQKDQTIHFGGISHTVNMWPRYPVTKENRFFKILVKLWCRFLCVVDPYSGWIIPAIKVGRKIIRENKINVIIATGPPFSSLVIGVLLKCFSKSDLVLDYRDPWSNINRSYQEGYIKRVNEAFEKLAIKKAKAIIVCTEMMKENFFSTFGKNLKEKCYVIYNGFQPVNSVEPRYLVGKPKIVYAGTLHGDRRIKLLIPPFVQLIEDGLINSDRFRFHIYGNLKDDDKKAIKESDLAKNFVEHQPLTHKELVRSLRSADLLVLLISERMKYSVSYKFFDYLSSCKPILAIVPRNSEMVRMMRDIKCGRYAYIDNEESIYCNLRQILTENKEYTPNAIERFHWSYLSKKYLKIIREMK